MRQPLKARAIIEAAYLNELFPWHLRGPRQDRTLHARLSVDISRNKENSLFYRNGPGKFFLRKFLYDAEIPPVFKNIYTARPRQKDLAKERILAFRAAIFSDVRRDGVTVPISRIIDALQEGRYSYENYSRVQGDNNLLPVRSFVIVHQGDEVLSFRRGSFFPLSDPLYGARSIGFGSEVTADNRDLLFDSLFGILASGVEELTYSIGLPHHHARDARYNNRLHPFVGIITGSGNRRRPALHVVMTYRCPEIFSPVKAALSVNELRWIDAANPANTLDDFDDASAFLFEQDYVRDMIRVCEAS